VLSYFKSSLHDFPFPWGPFLWKGNRINDLVHFSKVRQYSYSVWRTRVGNRAGPRGWSWEWTMTCLTILRLAYGGGGEVWRDLNSATSQRRTIGTK
jgi:hypothetical protein